MRAHRAILGFRQGGSIGRPKKLRKKQEHERVSARKNSIIPKSCDLVDSRLSDEAAVWHHNILIRLAIDPQAIPHPV